jgi:hypothetical protein
LALDSTLHSRSEEETNKVWNIADGTCVKTLEGHTDCVNASALAPDGTLYSASGDKTIKVHDKPLTLGTWAVVDVSTEETPDVSSEYHEAVAQITNIWKEAIPGMDLFHDHAKWFEPETDLKKISSELGIPVVALKDYRVDKGCFGMSSFFTDVYTGFHVIEGLAIDPSLGPLALEHACLCKIDDKGKVFAFDLVRKRPLFMYGVVVRTDMKKRMSEKCKDTWAGYSVINGLNYIKRDEDFWENNKI